MSSPTYNEHERITPNDGYKYSIDNIGALDLSIRRDSVETRKTPSPYESCEGSPPSYISPCPTNTAHLKHHRGVTGAQHHNHFRLQNYSNASDNMHMQNCILRSNGILQERPSPVKQSRFHQNFQAERTPQLMNKTVNDGLQAYNMSQAIEIQQRLAFYSQVINAKTNNDTETLKSISRSVVDQRDPLLLMGHEGKLVRPFKAYPRDRLDLVATYGSANVSKDDTEKYEKYRQSMMEENIHVDKKMRRSDNETTDDRKHDDDEFIEHKSNANTNSDSESTKGSLYRERRRKNNEAAKKSRDRRRLKEDTTAMHAAALEREHMKLKFQLQEARRQLAIVLAK